MDRINCIKPAYFKQDSANLDSGLVSVSLKSVNQRVGAVATSDKSSELGMEMKKFQKRARIIIIAGINLLLLYALACTYLWAEQSHFIFMPRREIKKTRLTKPCFTCTAVRSTSVPMSIMRAASITWVFPFFWSPIADTG
jgi:hypothetical protein